MPSGKPPKRSRPRDLSGYLEGISRVAFQGGISWRVVDAKWEGIKEAFAGFDPHTVADLDAGDIDALMADARVIRNRAKLEGTVATRRRCSSSMPSTAAFAATSTRSAITRPQSPI